MALENIAKLAYLWGKVGERTIGKISDNDELP